MITLDVALQLVHVALQEARAEKLSVAVVVVDRGGHIIASGRDDLASYFSLGAAEKKAVTAVNFGKATHVLLQFGQKDPVMMSALSSDATLSTLPGGLPILLDGTVVAAIGIAGAHYTQDQVIAEKAIAVLG